jgi:hypothetical protein
MEKVYYLYGKCFEWNESKSIQNKQKHGISFLSSLEVWASNHLEIEGIAKEKNGETREATIGQVNEQLWVVIWMQRNGNIRIISVRRARDGEKKIYHQKNL